MRVNYTVSLMMAASIPYLLPTIHGYLLIAPPTRGVELVHLPMITILHT